MHKLHKVIKFMCLKSTYRWILFPSQLIANYILGIINLYLILKSYLNPWFEYYLMWQNEEMSKIWKSANLCFLEYSKKDPTHITYKPVNDFPCTFKLNITVMFSPSLVFMIIF